MTTRTPLIQQQQQPKQPTIYPNYCHALSPTISRWCPLRALDIHALQDVGVYLDDHKPLYHLINHPIKWIRLTGILVAIDDFAERKILTIDDSSGMCIECVCANPPKVPPSRTADAPSVAVLKPEARPQISEGDVKPKGNATSATASQNAQPSVTNPSVPWDLLQIGLPLKIKGLVTQFRSTMQIETIKLTLIPSSDAEVKCWDEVLSFRLDVLAFPWVVTPEEEERLRREMAKGARAGRREKEGRNRKGEGEVYRTAVRKSESAEDRRPRHEAKKRKMERDARNGLERINHPSTAARRSAVGRYDILDKGE